MDSAYAGGFWDLETTAPCCSKTVSLNELRYVSPEAFGRFALEVRNPETAGPTEEPDRAVGECVGMSARNVGRIIRFLLATYREAPALGQQFTLQRTAIFSRL